MRCNLSCVLAAVLFLGLGTSASATTIGPGTSLPGTLIFDAIEITAATYAAPVVLGAGTYNVSDFIVYTNASTGTVVPFLATLSTTPNNPTFTSVWVGPDHVGDNVLGVHTYNYTAGTQQFTLAGTTSLYSGFYADTVAHVGTTLSFTTTTAADNSFGHPGPAGSVIGGGSPFLYPNLDSVSARTYAYQIDVQFLPPPVPEPASCALVGLGMMFMGSARRRNRQQA